MNKFFILINILFLLSTATLAQTTITFKNMGHDDEVMQGMSGSITYFMKVDERYNMNGGKLALYFQPSQALNFNQCFINIIINDRPMYSTRLTADSIQHINLNLSNDDLSRDRYLKIQIKSALAITADKCKDLDNPAMWLRIKSYSYIIVPKNSHTDYFTGVNISNVFSTMRAVVYPVNPSLLDLKAAAWAYSRLKKAYQERRDQRSLRVYQADRLPDSMRDYIAVGQFSKLTPAQRAVIKVSPQKGEGLMYLNKSIMSWVDTAASTASTEGKTLKARSNSMVSAPSQVLFITGADDEGYEKTITTLANINILNSTFGDYLLINKASNTGLKTIDESRSKLTLRQIGGTPNFMSGIGVFKSAYNFKNSDFSFTPKNIEIRITGNYSSLAPGDRGYMNIYLNGMLIQSEQLGTTGKLNTSVTIDRYQHHKYNTLETEFRFNASGGNCMSAFSNFFAEIDVDKSYLESKNPFITSELSFYQYPEAFNNKSTRLVVSHKYAPFAIGALGEIIYELNNNISSNNFPEIVYSDDLSSSDLKKYNVIALLSRDDKLFDQFPDAPIKFNEKFRLYNNDNNQVVYALSDSTSNGLAQIFYGRSNNATLVLTATGTHPASAFLSVAQSITEQLSTLSSNVCIADASNNKYLFNINKSSENLEYIDTKSALSRFWESYNLYILLGILILILLSFLYVRSRVQRSQDIMND